MDFIREPLLFLFAAVAVFGMIPDSTAVFNSIRRQNLNYNVLPDDLKDHGRFCAWRYENRNGRRTKVPYHPLSGEAARSNNPDSFVSFSEAVHANGYDGIGIGIFNGLCVVDLDDCITDSGYIKQPAADIIHLMHSYTEDNVIRLRFKRTLPWTVA